jgi:choline/ethanolamine kinase
MEKNIKARVFSQCRELFPAWSALSMEDFDFDEPKGFSSFTMGVRCKKPVEPAAVFYRRLAGKENAILDFESEKEVFLTLGADDIAARCHYYGDDCRIEAFYRGRTLTRKDLTEPDTLCQIAGRLYRFHRLRPPCLPRASFFDLLHDKWGRIARRVLEEELTALPADELEMCRELRQIYSPETFEKVRSLLPREDLVFCHNDTYHGNIMKLDTGEIRLLDFEFSCLNHRAYDFANLFAETVMRHQRPEYPHFRIAAPEFGEGEIGMLIDFYLDNADFKSEAQKTAEFRKLVHQTLAMLLLPDYKYAMAALPLAVDPIQKIGFKSPNHPY